MAGNSLEKMRDKERNRSIKFWYISRHKQIKQVKVLFLANIRLNVIAAGWHFIGESGVIWTGFGFSRVGPFLIIRFVK
jgi:hypothetical protein